MKSPKWAYGQGMALGLGFRAEGLRYYGPRGKERDVKASSSLECSGYRPWSLLIGCIAGKLSGITL